MDPAVDALVPWAELTETLAPWIPFVLLVSLRVGVVFAALPAPFGSGAPVPVRVALSVLVAITLALPHGELAHGLSLAPAALLRAAVLEVVVGTVIGLTVRVIVAAVEVAGSLVDLSSGLGFAGTVNPALGESASPLGVALSTLSVLFFFAFDGHVAVLHALGASLQAAPPGAIESSFELRGAVSLGSDLVARGLRIASPVVATMFLVQLGLALVSRAAPRVHLFAFSFSIAISAGVLVLYVAAPSVAAGMAEEVRRIPDVLASLFGA
ncbi:MAG: flagellar biosynthetic protein FliR [Sandaracinus sp.]|nr:flagellar biosynthetic protein FliR [Sandaracinus sp.]MCB9632465.1 flagellar biosynthetic protein FliR [Sandaracinus sp.]